MKIYDTSQLSQYQKCPMSYYLQYIKNLKRKTLDDTNASMNFGTAFHSYLENKFKGAMYDFNTYLQPEALPQYSTEALRFFCDTYTKKNGASDKNFKVKEIEVVSEIDIEDKKFKVKCDGVIELQGNIYGIEHKTTKSIGYLYFNKYFLNAQISAQCYAIKQKYGECSGVLLNVGEIKILKNKPRSDTDGWKQTDDGFLVANFQREYINRSNYELSDWVDNTKKWIKIIESASEYPKATASWGGGICSSCQYKDLCKVSHGIELDESILDLFYEEYNSTEYLENKGE